MNKILKLLLISSMFLVSFTQNQNVTSNKQNGKLYKYSFYISNYDNLEKPYSLKWTLNNYFKPINSEVKLDIRNPQRKDYYEIYSEQIFNENEILIHFNQEGIILSNISIGRIDKLSSK
jgi:hypothetical protein